MVFDGKFGSFSIHQVGGSSREKPSFLRRGSIFLACGEVWEAHAWQETNDSCNYM